MTDKDFWVALRQALLLMVDAIERRFDLSPRTAELRKKNYEDARPSTGP